MTSAFHYPMPTRNYWKSVPNPGHNAVRYFSPQLFIVCMGTGSLAVLLRQNPYQFNGLEIIADVVWILDILLFSLNVLTFVARWIMYPMETGRMFESDIEQTTYLSTSSIALATIIEMIALVPGERWNNWQYVSFAFWWLAVLWSSISATTTYWLLIRDERVEIDNLMPTLMYPTTGLLATASCGSVIVTYTPLDIKLSQPVMIVSYLLLGAGFFLALVTIAAYFIRLLHNQTPEPKKVGAQFIPVAAMSNAAYAIVSLGYLAGPDRHIIDYYSEGPVSEAQISNAMYAVGIVFGLMIWGFASFWIIFSVIALIRDSPKTKFNANMWSAAYPIGAYGLACSHFSTDFNSEAFAVITTIILTSLIIYWLYLFFYTLPLAISGELFLAEAWEEMQKHKQGQEEKGIRGERQREHERAADLVRQERDEEEEEGEGNRGTMKRNQRRSADEETAVE